MGISPENLMNDHYIPPDACVPMDQAFQKGDQVE